MEVITVKRQIKDGQLCPFYIFTGEEIEAQRRYIEKIADVTNRTVTRVDTVADVLRYKQGLIKVPRLFVVMDDKDFMTAEKAWDSIEDLLKDKMLILQISVLDKRLKFSKHFADKIVTFHYMTNDVLYKYVQKECKLSDKNTETLIQICGNDYSRILLEIDKIKQYENGQRAVDSDIVNEPLTTSKRAVDQIFEKLVYDGTIYRQPEDAIFKFVDAVLKASPERAYRLLEDCKAIDESSLAILTVLYNNFKRVLQVQSCTSSDICKSTGLTSKEVAIARKNTGYYNTADIVDFLRFIQAVERGIKTGEVGETEAVEYALTHIF